jgi:transposase
MYDIYHRRITECDQQLQKHLASFSKTILSSPPEAEPKRKRSKPAKNAPQFELRSELQRITGVDLTRIDGIDVMVAQTLVSEIGLDMSRWKTEAHFASWLGLCPDNRTSGDKILNRGTRHVINRAATARCPVQLVPVLRACNKTSFSQLTAAHCSFAYSALACFRIGMSGSASFQRVRKS